MTMHPLFAMPAAPAAPSIRLPHPLADEAAAEGLDARHLAVTAGPPPLPILLLRAETRLQQEEATPSLTIRFGVLVDARAMAGHRHRLRGTLSLRVDPDALTLLEAELGSLEWQAVQDGGWSRVPLDRARGYGGRAAQVAAQLADWAMTPEAEATLAAALGSGAGALTRSAAGFESDAALHEFDASRAEASEQHRARALSWVAQQRGNAARQRRHAALLLRVAAQLRTADDLPRQDMLLTLAAAAARRHDTIRAAAKRQAEERAAQVETARRTRRHDAAQAARLAAQAARLATAAPALLAALERLLVATGSDQAAAVESARALLTGLRREA